MAKVTWQVAEPAPDPFEASSGDFREYAVQLCTVSEAGEPEIPDLFVDFFRRAFEAALTVERVGARKILMEIDTVYAMMTIVVTDDARSYDEQDVFKLSMDVWDVGGAGEVADESEEAEAAKFRQVMTRFRESTRLALEDERLSPLRAELRAHRFRLWIYDQDEEEPGATLAELTPEGA